jgi:hypothetical protein
MHLRLCSSETGCYDEKVQQPIIKRCQQFSYQKNVLWKKEIFNMKGAMALSAFRAGVGGKPKWGTLIRKNFVF